MIGETKRRAVGAATVIALVMTVMVIAAPAASSAAGSSVSGTVTDASSAPLADTKVEAVDKLGNRYFAKTAADGTYAIADLPNQHYYVKFTKAGYQPEYFDGSSTVDGAQTLTVQGSTVFTGIDAALDAPTEIGGTVTDEETTSGLGGIKVDIYSTSGVRQETLLTESDGSWSAVGVPPGDYKVRFVDLTETYVREWWDGVQYVGGEFADVVVLPDGGAVSGIDASLQAAVPGSLSGTVTDEDTGLPINKLTIVVSDQFGRKTKAKSAADGTWSISGLFPSIYTVNFRGKAGVYLPEWYDDAPSQSTSDPVLVAIGSSVSGIDATLAPVGGP